MESTHLFQLHEPGFLNPVQRYLPPAQLDQGMLVDLPVGPSGRILLEE